MALWPAEPELVEDVVAACDAVAAEAAALDADVAAAAADAFALATVSELTLSTMLSMKFSSAVLTAAANAVDALLTPSEEVPSDIVNDPLWMWRRHA